MVKTTYGPASELDFFKTYGVIYPDEWKGMSLKIGQYVAAFGGYTTNDAGETYVFIDIGSPIARTPILYRRALHFLKEMKEEGIEQVFTVCDETKPNAERFLLRLGFNPTQHFLLDLRVWSKWLD